MKKFKEIGFYKNPEVLKNLKCELRIYLIHTNLTFIFRDLKVLLSY